MVLLTATPTIISAIGRIPESDRIDLCLPEAGNAISHTQLIKLARKLKQIDCGREKLDSNAGYGTLSHLLRGTTVYVPPPPPKPEPSPEYLALKAKLLADAERKQYNLLVKPLSEAQARRQPDSIFASQSDATLSSSPSSLLFDTTIESDPISPSLILNILISILFTGFAAFWGLSNFRIPRPSTLSTWSRRKLSTTHISQHSTAADYHAHYYYPKSPESQAFRVFVSLFVAVLVGVAEVVIYAAYLRKVERAKNKEQSRVEKKSIKRVDALLQEPSERIESFDFADKGKREEVWGRGPNGGTRRRVREKWKENETE